MPATTRAQWQEQTAQKNDPPAGCEAIVVTEAMAGVCLDDMTSNNKKKKGGATKQKNRSNPRARQTLQQQPPKAEMQQKLPDGWSGDRNLRGAPSAGSSELALMKKLFNGDRSAMPRIQEQTKKRERMEEKRQARLRAARLAEEEQEAQQQPDGAAAASLETPKRFREFEKRRKKKCVEEEKRAATDGQAGGIFYDMLREPTQPRTWWSRTPTARRSGHGVAVVDDDDSDGHDSQEILVEDSDEGDPLTIPVEYSVMTTISQVHAVPKCARVYAVCRDALTDGVFVCFLAEPTPESPVPSAECWWIERATIPSALMPAFRVPVEPGNPASRVVEKAWFCGSPVLPEQLEHVKRRLRLSSENVYHGEKLLLLRAAKPLDEAVQRHQRVSSGASSDPTEQKKATALDWEWNTCTILPEMFWSDLDTLKAAASSGHPLPVCTEDSSPGQTPLLFGETWIDSNWLTTRLGELPIIESLAGSRVVFPAIKQRLSTKPNTADDF